MLTTSSDIVLLASSSGEGINPLVSFAWIMSVALLAPIISYATGKRIPAVVVLIGFGMIIGPNVLGLASQEGGVGMIKELGLGMLFLLAGYEIDPKTLQGTESKRGLLTWLICIVISFIGAFAIMGFHSTATAIVLAIAFTSTAVGTLLPIMKQQGMLNTNVGKSLMIHGAIGEIAPVIAMALLLSTRATWVNTVVLFAFFFIALLVAAVPRSVHAIVPWVGKAMIDGAGSTNQTILRFTIWMLGILMAVASAFELDVVLGAFAAGFILRQMVPDKYRIAMEQRLDVLGYSLLIPVFFVCSGMGINPQSVAKHPFLLMLFVPLIFITRGLPVFIVEMCTDTGSGLKDWREKAQLSLYSATALPIIVAVTQVALTSGLMTEEYTSLLVAAGSITVLLFPLLASLLKDPKDVSRDKVPSSSAEEAPKATTKTDAKSDEKSKTK